MICDDEIKLTALRIHHRNAAGAASNKMYDRRASRHSKAKWEKLFHFHSDAADVLDRCISKTQARIDATGQGGA